MSTYLYGLKGPKHVVKNVRLIRPDGESFVADVAIMEFMWGNAHDRASRMQKLRIGKKDSLWKGQKRPEYVASAEKLGPGILVHFFPGGAPVVFTDTPHYYGCDPQKSVRVQALL